MAHELQEDDTMFSARVTPWHGLGTVTADTLGGQEAIVAAGLDWTVDLGDLYAIPAGLPHLPEHMTPATDHHAVIRDRDQKVLGVVGGQYTPVQNGELFGFVDDILDSGDAHFETAGSLRGGRVVFITARLNRDVTVDGDRLVPYLVVASSHDGTMGVRALATPVRVVCANTLRLAAASAASEYYVRHTASATHRVAEARQALGMSWRYLDGFEAEVAELLAQDVTTAQQRRHLAHLFPTSDDRSNRTNERQQARREAVLTILYEDPTVRDYAGSGWGLLNAVNSWEDRKSVV